MKRNTSSDVLCDECYTVMPCRKVADGNQQQAEKNQYNSMSALGNQFLSLGLTE
jgi:hypothetical protein